MVLRGQTSTRPSDNRQGRETGKLGGQGDLIEEEGGCCEGGGASGSSVGGGGNFARYLT